MKIHQMQPSYDEHEIDAVVSYMRSGGWLTDFTKTRELEKVIAEFTGAKYCSIVNSGTTALQIALMACEIDGADEVVVPCYTMPATAYAVSLVGGNVKLVDIDRNTFNIDAIRINPKSMLCVMPVSINGRGYGIKEICDNAENHFVIEDAAQSFGSRIDGKHLGTFGDIGMLSLNTFKLISTGQGGVLLTDNEFLYNRMVKIKDYGRPSGRGSQYECLGMNAKFTDIQAVIGLEQMKKIAWRIKRKKAMFKLYQKHLQYLDQVHFIKTNLEDCSPWFIDPLVEKRDELIEYLAAHDIETQPFYPPLHHLPYYSDFKNEKFPNAEYVSEHGIWLPSSVTLTDGQIEMICIAIKEFYRR